MAPLDSPPKHSHRLSGEFEMLERLCEPHSITLRTLISEMGTRGHALFALLFAVPFLLPIPLPGLSIFFGTCIAMAGIRMTMGKPLWFPRSWMDKPLSSKLFRKIFHSGATLMKRLEIWIRPRGAFFHKHSWVRGANGLMLATCGFLLALPLPPGTNFPPAVAIILLATGTLEEDGLFLSLGYIAFIGNIVFFSLLPFLGLQGIRALWT